MLGGPAVVPVAPVERRDEQAAVGEDAQGAYTVSSTVALRSAGPSIDPT